MILMGRNVMRRLSGGIGRVGKMGGEWGKGRVVNVFGG